MIIFAGPFIGEFGWELSYWHAWLRFIKKEKYPDSKMIVSSYPGREQLYNFADHFIPLSDKFIKKNYSQRAYFLDFNNEIEKDKLRTDLLELYKYLHNKVPYGDYIQISCYPQKIKTTNFLYRIKKKFDVFNVRKNYISNFNHFAGKEIKEPFHLNFPFDEKKYFPQYPHLKDQIFEELTPTKQSCEISQEIISKYTKKKHIFTLFPRKRDQRRIDKNWGEDKWKSFINLLIERYDPLIILCGTNNGSYFYNLQNDKNIFNSIGYNNNINLLDLQISLIKRSHISIHGLSGSAILSLLANKKTFMYGNIQEFRTICIEGNPLNTELFYYTDEELNPSPKKLFNKFINFYENE